MYLLHTSMIECMADAYILNIKLNFHVQHQGREEKVELRLLFLFLSRLLAFTNQCCKLQLTVAFCRKCVRHQGCYRKSGATAPVPFLTEIIWLYEPMLQVAANIHFLYTIFP